MKDIEVQDKRAQIGNAPRGPRPVRNFKKLTTAYE
jgi:hypothetical protein